MLRAVLTDVRTQPTLTRSDLEDLFLTFLDAHGLPRAQVNVGIEVRGRWMECDCVWRAHRLIVELDGRETHDTGAAFDRELHVDAEEIRQIGRELYERFVGELRGTGLIVRTGQFGERMQVELVNDGPVTFILEEREREAAAKAAAAEAPPQPAQLPAAE